MAPMRPISLPDLWWFALLASGMLTGALAMAYVLSHGHVHAFAASPEPAWGVLITTGEFLVLAAGGLALAAALGRFSGACGEDCRRALPAAGFALGVALAAVVVDLTHPMRLAFSTASGGELYRTGGTAAGLFGLALLCLGGEWAALRRGRRRLPLLLALLGWGAALAALLQTGEVLALIESPPSWHHSLLLLRATLSALVLGGALFPLGVFLGSRLREGSLPAAAQRQVESFGRLLALLLPLLAGYLLLERALAPPSGLAALRLWGAEAALGVGVPALLLWRRGAPAPARVLPAALLAVAGQFVMHHSRVVGAQLEPATLWNYLPCLPKGSVAVGALAFWLFLCSLAEKLRVPGAEGSDESP